MVTSSHNARIYETRALNCCYSVVLFTRKHVMRPKANPGAVGGGGGGRGRPRTTAWCASIQSIQSIRSISLVLLVVTTLVALNTVGVILRSAPERETTDHTNRRDAPVLTNSHSDELATTHRLTTNDDRVLSLQLNSQGAAETDTKDTNDRRKIPIDIEERYIMTDTDPTVPLNQQVATVSANVLSFATKKKIGSEWWLVGDRDDTGAMVVQDDEQHINNSAFIIDVPPNDLKF